MAALVLGSLPMLILSKHLPSKQLIHLDQCLDGVV